MENKGGGGGVPLRGTVGDKLYAKKDFIHIISIHLSIKSEGVGEKRGGNERMFDFI